MRRWQPVAQAAPGSADDFFPTFPSTGRNAIEIFRHHVPVDHGWLGVGGRNPIGHIGAADLLDPHLLSEAESTLAGVEPFTADTIETALRRLAERLELSPRKAFQPIRVAVTGSKISPGLFESLELLGREKSLARIRAAASELA